MKNVTIVVLLATVLVLSSCSNASKQSAGARQPTATSPGKVYSLEDVNQELNDAGVKANSTQEVAREFFKTHPAYTVCQDYSDVEIIAVVRNRKLNPNADDQYIVIAYDKGKLTNLEIGPPQFSPGNLASYCQ